MTSIAEQQNEALGLWEGISSGAMQLENEDKMPQVYNQAYKRLVNFRNEASGLGDTIIRRIVFVVASSILFTAGKFEMIFNCVVTIASLKVAILSGEKSNDESNRARAIKYGTKILNFFLLVIRSPLILMENFYCRELKLDGSVSEVKMFSMMVSSPEEE